MKAVGAVAYTVGVPDGGRVGLVMSPPVADALGPVVKEMARLRRVELCARRLARVVLEPLSGERGIALSEAGELGLLEGEQ